MIKETLTRIRELIWGKPKPPYIFQIPDKNPIFLNHTLVRGDREESNPSVWVGVRREGESLEFFLENYPEIAEIMASTSKECVAVIGTPATYRDYFEESGIEKLFCQEDCVTTKDLTNYKKNGNKEIYQGKPGVG